MKLTSKLITLSIAVVAVLAIAWLVNNNATRATTKARIAFYADAQRNIADENNLFVAITGLEAPAEQGILEYGRHRIDEFHQTEGVELKYALADKPRPNDTHVVPLDEKDEVNCNDGATVELLNGGCITPQKLEALMQQNSLLLQRHMHLQSFTDWQGPNIHANKASILIQLNALMYPYINLLLAQQKPEQAYEIWKNNHAFILHALGLQMGSGYKMDFSAAYEFSLKTLENLLVKAPDTVMAHYNEIDNMLLLNGLEKFNIKGMLNAEYLWIDMHAHSYKNVEKIIDIEHFRNTIYLFHKDLLAMVELPPKQAGQAKEALFDKHVHISKFASRFKRYIQSNKKHDAEYLFRRTAWGLYATSDLESFNIPIALTRSLKAAINMHQQQIKPNGIQAFLNQAGAAYHCPFTEKPMIYNAKKQTIWCENPIHQYNETEVKLAVQ